MKRKGERMPIEILKAFPPSREDFAFSSIIDPTVILAYSITKRCLALGS